jgi:hypothetical protein
MDAENIYDQLCKIAENSENNLQVLLACTKTLFCLPMKHDEYLINHEYANILKNKIMKQIEESYEKTIS